MAKATKEPEDTPLVFDLDLDDTTIGGMVRRRASEAISHWEKEYDLKKVRETNKKLYNSEDVKNMARDERYEEIFSDNKLFTSVRTLVPFLTTNMTQPEITPANSDDLSLQFAQDFEKILVEVGEDLYARDKVKLAIQDLLTGQRVGILKWVADASGNLFLEHIDPASVIIGKRSRLREEPDFVQHTQERTIGELCRQFPDKQDALYKLYGIEKGVPSQLEQVKKITENWIFVEEEDAKKLAIVWMAGETTVLGKMSDPNWVENGDNLAKEHMMPFVFFNFLNDGSGYIDNTSFIEQAQYNQKNYDKRGSTIAENAAYAGIGVPVFGKGAVKEETAAKVRFSPVQRVLLDIEDVNKGFTTWTAGQLPSFVFEDKQDMKNSVMDIFGSNQIQQGSTPDNPNDNLGQDVILRNQAEGRQQELIDCVDNGMSRFYEVESQMIYRYFDDVHYYNFIGDDGDFEHLAISQAKIAKNLGIKIKIKSGTSLPVDRSQKLATVLKLAEMKRIGTLKLYKELGIEDPEQAYKEYLEENLLPFAQLGEMDKDIESREAEEDLQTVIGGKMPEDREDIDDDYIAYLNSYIADTQKYEQLPQTAQKRVSQFIANVIAQAERKVLKQSTQQPIVPASTGQLPPIRPKISLSGRDLQPDVLGQVVQNAGYKASQLTQAEMAAGIMGGVQERINANPLTNPAVGGENQNEQQQAAMQQQQQQLPPAPVPTKVKKK